MPSTPTLRVLRDQIRRLEMPTQHGVLPFEVAAIDGALPNGGLALGAMHEILGVAGDEEDGAAAAGFVAGILARLGMANGSRPVLWCLKQPDLYGPGLRQHGLDSDRLVLVQAARDDALLWAVEEGLHTPGLAAVVGEIGRLPMIAGRRLQLAAEHSGVTALLLRRWRNGAEAAAERTQPSAASTRWRVATVPAMDTGEPGIGRPRWQVELLRNRGGLPGNWIVEVADATGHVSLSPPLADRSAAPVRQRSGQPERQQTASFLSRTG